MNVEVWPCGTAMFCWHNVLFSPRPTLLSPTLTLKSESLFPQQSPLLVTFIEYIRAVLPKSTLHQGNGVQQPVSVQEPLERLV